MPKLILAVFSGALTVMVPAVAAQELELLQVHAGFVSEAPGDFDSLGLPELALSPDFEEDTTSYAATLPFSASGISLVAVSPLGSRIVAAEGKTADGQPLALDGSRVSGLVPGTNTLEITVTAEDGTTTAGYTVAVTRARPAADATRADSNEDAGGACVVGLELSPGQSCTHSAAGTFTVLEGGCANVSSIPIGRLCGADINANGLRATPVNDVNFRIDALP